MIEESDMGTLRKLQLQTAKDSFDVRNRTFLQVQYCDYCCGTYQNVLV